MKKNLWISLGSLLVMGAVAASAQEVLSANAVGYIKKELPPSNKLITVSIPLFNMTMTENVFSNLSLSSEVPLLSEVYFWNPVSQRWDGGAKSGKGWPAGVVTQIVTSGEFFFLKGPPGATDPTEFTITGEVPTDNNLARAMPGTNALGSMANPYPTDFVFGDSSLSSNATLLSEVSFWNVDEQRWVGGAKSGKGWPATVTTQVVIATEGFFMKEAGTVYNWTNSKPYTWP